MSQSQNRMSSCFSSQKAHFFLLLNRLPESELCGDAGGRPLDDGLLALGEVRAELDLAVHNHRVRVRRLLLLGLTITKMSKKGYC